MPYLVFFQPIDQFTNPANAALSGEVFDLEQLLDEKGGGKSYCDGQVSPTPPRHSDDGMLGLFFEDKGVAEQFSQILRDDVARRVSSGQLKLTFDIPWLQKAAFSVAAVEAVTSEVRLRFPPEITDSQLLTASRACAQQLGRVPTADELFYWIEENRSFSGE